MWTNIAFAGVARRGGPRMPLPILIALEISQVSGNSVTRKSKNNTTSENEAPRLEVGRKSVLPTFLSFPAQARGATKWGHATPGHPRPRSFDNIEKIAFVKNNQQRNEGSSGRTSVLPAWRDEVDIGNYATPGTPRPRNIKIPPVLLFLNEKQQSRSSARASGEGAPTFYWPPVVTPPTLQCNRCAVDAKTAGMRRCCAPELSATHRCCHTSPPLVPHLCDPHRCCDLRPASATSAVADGGARAPRHGCQTSTAL